MYYNIKRPNFGAFNILRLYNAYFLEMMPFS